MGHDIVSSVDFISGTGLEGGVVERVAFARAVRILGSAAVAHLAVAHEVGV